MLYISSGSVRGDKIADRVEKLARAGFNRIELSGGTRYYEDYLDDLLKLKQKYKLNYLIHNYFPPPREEFVLNLASLRTEIKKKSLELCSKAINDAIVLESPCYSVHAGFYFDPEIDELGNLIKTRNLYDAVKSQNIFKECIEVLKEFSEQQKIKLYIENNVVNRESYKSLNGIMPSMLLCYEDVKKLWNNMDYNLLLDIGHLKVTSNSLGIDFKNECFELIPRSDYLHLSDNNGFTDENKYISKHSDIYRIVSKYDLSKKVIVLEINDLIDNIKTSYELIMRLISPIEEDR